MNRLAGVLGFPVGHSRSPAIHNAAYEVAGLDWRYLKLPVPPELFGETVAALGEAGFRGANVTIPHKVTALEAADRASPAAEAIGAANTLTFADGRIEAENTDAAGLVACLPEPVVGKRALVLGAGGAARAAVWALDGEGAEVSVWNRTGERAAALASELGVAAVDEPFAADLLVNATSVGLGGGGQDETAAMKELGLDRLAVPAVVVDLPYGEGETPVVAWARAGGAEVVDGLEVLVRQGALSFELWTGVEAPLDAMRAAARPS